LNPVNPRKLLNSKWTAVSPVDREKHFVVSSVEFDDEGRVVSCLIEAVLSKRERPIDWRELKDESKWLQGWK